MKTILMITFTFLICPTSWALDWSAADAAVIPAATCTSQFKNSEFIKSPLTKNSEETLDLFYFTLNPFNAKLPTLLYIDGGPGQAIGANANLLRFKNSPDFNIVFFHPRSSGCSQLPLNNIYDKYIRTEYLVNDLEVLRKHLGLKKWDILFGLSYGVVPAMKYAEAHPEALSEIILEGFYIPTYPRNPNLLGFTLGVPTLILIADRWTEYDFLTPEQIQFLIDELITRFPNSGKIHKISGAELTDIENQELFSRLFELSYQGVYSPGSMNKNAAFAAIYRILGILFSPEVANLAPIPKYEFENSLPYFSMRMFANMNAYDTLDLNFYSWATQPGKTLENAIKEFYGQTAPTLAVEPNHQLKMLEYGKTFDKNLHFTFLLGTHDGPTPYEGATDYLKTIDANFNLYGLRGYGHQRHFADTCYDLIFKQVAQHDTIADLLTTEGSECFLPEGYVTL